MSGKRVQNAVNPNSGTCLLISQRSTRGFPSRSHPPLTVDLGSAKGQGAVSLPSGNHQPTSPGPMPNVLLQNLDGYLSTKHHEPLGDMAGQILPEHLNRIGGIRFGIFT